MPSKYSHMHIGITSIRLPIASWVMTSAANAKN